MNIHDADAARSGASADEARRASVRRILVEAFEIEPERVVDGATLKDDLGLDSLDHVDLVLELERLLGRRIPTDELRGIMTVGDVNALLARQEQTAA